MWGRLSIAYTSSTSVAASLNSCVQQACKIEKGVSIESKSGVISCRGSCASRTSRSTVANERFRMKVLRTTRSATVVLILLLAPALVRAQTSNPDKQSSPEHDQQSQHSGNAGGSAPKSPAGTQSKPQTTAPAPAPVPSSADQKKDNSEGKQTKRMFWVIPNFAAVSANAQLPPLSAREKFVIAM